MGEELVPPPLCGDGERAGGELSRLCKETQAAHVRPPPPPQYSHDPVITASAAAGNPY